MSAEQRDSRFVLTNARVMRVKELEKVAFMTVECMAGRFANRFDVTLFDPQLVRPEGDAVTITGDLSMRKPKEQGGKWELQLIARKVEKGDDSKAPSPRQRRAEAAPAPVDESDDVDF
jgi:hypothetical protein